MEWALFFSAFIASTLFPGGSEALLLYSVHEGGNASRLLWIATVGNVLGSIVTYMMGWFAHAALHQRWLRMDANKLHQASHYFEKYGKFSLLFAWLPVIGDPLCFMAGMLRCSWLWFLCLVSLGKL
ncbi:MAG: YqaA family protein, partial [Mariprofundaceae bacterium]|nr:YqaA family protein [Mariprofundaceae bacterium]